jgi:hypothetical protein
LRTYLFTMLPSNDLGLLARSLPIARELKSRGRRVVFCCQGGAPRKRISEAGFENRDLDWPLLDIMAGDAGIKSMFELMKSRHFARDAVNLAVFLRQMARHGTAEVWNLDHFMFLMGMGIESHVRAYVKAMADLIDEIDPDAVVDFWNPWACIAAKLRRKPLVTVIQSDMHPMCGGFIWWKQVPSGVPSPVRAVNSVLSENGMAPIQRTGELVVGDRTLVVGIPEMDPLPDGADAIHIGPILWHNPGETLPDPIKKAVVNRPVVWLYPGNLRYMKGARTAFDGSVVLEACVEALGGEKMQVVLTTGHQPIPASFLPLPRNFIHAPFAPGLPMAEACDLLIHHGGYASCQTGLFAGKPALIIPTYSERESNARRTAARGGGDLIVPETDASGVHKRLKPEEVRSKVFNLLENPFYRENARRIGAALRSHGGAAYAAGIIDHFIGEWPPIAGNRLNKMRQ